MNPRNSRRSRKKQASGLVGDSYGTREGKEAESKLARCLSLLRQITEGDVSGDRLSKNSKEITRIISALGTMSSTDIQKQEICRLVLSTFQEDSHQAQYAGLNLLGLLCVETSDESGDVQMHRVFEQSSLTVNLQRIGLSTILECLRQCVIASDGGFYLYCLISKITLPDSSRKYNALLDLCHLLESRVLDVCRAIGVQRTTMIFETVFRETVVEADGKASLYKETFKVLQSVCNSLLNSICIMLTSEGREMYVAAISSSLRTLLVQFPNHKSALLQNFAVEVQDRLLMSGGLLASFRCSTSQAVIKPLALLYTHVLRLLPDGALIVQLFSSEPSPTVQRFNSHVLLASLRSTENPLPCSGFSAIKLLVIIGDLMKSVGSDRLWDEERLKSIIIYFGRVCAMAQDDITDILQKAYDCCILLCKGTSQTSQDQAIFWLLMILRRMEQSGEEIVPSDKELVLELCSMRFQDASFKFPIKAALQIMVLMFSNGILDDVTCFQGIQETYECACLLQQASDKTIFKLSRDLCAYIGARLALLASYPELNTLSYDVTRRSHFVPDDLVHHNPVLVRKYLSFLLKPKEIDQEFECWLKPLEIPDMPLEKKRYQIHPICSPPSQRLQFLRVAAHMVIQEPNELGFDTFDDVLGEYESALSQLPEDLEKSQASPRKKLHELRGIYLSELIFQMESISYAVSGAKEVNALRRFVMRNLRCIVQCAVLLNRDSVAIYYGLQELRSLGHKVISMQKALLKSKKDEIAHQILRRPGDSSRGLQQNRSEFEQVELSFFKSLSQLIPILTKGSHSGLIAGIKALAIERFGDPKKWAWMDVAMAQASGNHYKAFRILADLIAQDDAFETSSHFLQDILCNLCSSIKRYDQSFQMNQNKVNIKFNDMVTQLGCWDLESEFSLPSSELFGWNHVFFPHDGPDLASLSFTDSLKSLEAHYEYQKAINLVLNASITQKILLPRSGFLHDIRSHAWEHFPSTLNITQRTMKILDESLENLQEMRSNTWKHVYCEEASKKRMDVTKLRSLDWDLRGRYLSILWDVGVFDSGLIQETLLASLELDVTELTEVQKYVQACLMKMYLGLDLSSVPDFKMGNNGYAWFSLASYLSHNSSEKMFELEAWCNAAKHLSCHLSTSDSVIILSNVLRLLTLANQQSQQDQMNALVFLLGVPVLQWKMFISYLISVYKAPEIEEWLKSTIYTLLLNFSNEDPVAMMFAVCGMGALNLAQEFPVLKNGDCTHVKSFCLFIKTMAKLKEERWHAVLMDILSEVKSVGRKSISYLQSRDRNKIEVEREYLQSFRPISLVVKSYLKFIQDSPEEEQALLKSNGVDKLLHKLLNCLQHFKLCEKNVLSNFDIKSKFEEPKRLLEKFDVDQKLGRSGTFEIHDAYWKGVASAAQPIRLSFDFIPGNEEIEVERIDSFVHVINSKNRPKRVTIISIDGSQHQFLVKGNEDLRIDGAISSLFSLFADHQNQMNSFRHWEIASQITPLRVLATSPNSGLVGWFERCPSLFDTYMRHIYRLNEKNSDNSDIKNPLEDHKRCLLSHGVDITLPRRNWPKAAIVSTFYELLSSTPKEYVIQNILEFSRSPKELLKRRKNLNLSMAVMSVLGYMLGLGDRHLSNILLNQDDSKIVHVDFAVNLDRGFRLRIPERVPFRLTQSMQYALNSHIGIHGDFKEMTVRTTKAARMSSCIFELFLSFQLKIEQLDWMPDIMTQTMSGLFKYLNQCTFAFSSFNNFDWLKDENYALMDDLAANSIKQFCDSFQQIKSMCHILSFEKMMNTKVFNEKTKGGNDLEGRVRERLEEAFQACKTLSSDFADLKISDPDYISGLHKAVTACQIESASVPVNLVDSGLDGSLPCMIEKAFQVPADQSPVSDSLLLEASFADAKLRQIHQEKLDIVWMAVAALERYKSGELLCHGDLPHATYHQAHVMPQICASLKEPEHLLHEDLGASDIIHEFISVSSSFWKAKNACQGLRMVSKTIEAEHLDLNLELSSTQIGRIPETQEENVLSYVKNLETVCETYAIEMNFDALLESGVGSLSFIGNTLAAWNKNDASLMIIQSCQMNANCLENIIYHLFLASYGIATLLSLDRSEVVEEDEKERLVGDVSGTLNSVVTSSPQQSSANPKSATLFDQILGLIQDLYTSLRILDDVELQPNDKLVASDVHELATLILSRANTMHMDCVLQDYVNMVKDCFISSTVCMRVSQYIEESLCSLKEWIEIRPERGKTAEGGEFSQGSAFTDDILSFSRESNLPLFFQGESSSCIDLDELETFSSSGKSDQANTQKLVRLSGRKLCLLQQMEAIKAICEKYESELYTLEHRLDRLKWSRFYFVVPFLEGRGSIPEMNVIEKPTLQSTLQDLVHAHSRLKTMKKVKDTQMRNVLKVRDDILRKLMKSVPQKSDACCKIWDEARQWLGDIRNLADRLRGSIDIILQYEYSKMMYAREALCPGHFVKKGALTDIYHSLLPDEFCPKVLQQAQLQLIDEDVERLKSITSFQDSMPKHKTQHDGKMKKLKEETQQKSAQTNKEDRLPNSEDIKEACDFLEINSMKFVKTIHTISSNVLVEFSNHLSHLVQGFRFYSRSLESLENEFKILESMNEECSKSLNFHRTILNTFIGLHANLERLGEVVKQLRLQMKKAKDLLDSGDKGLKAAKEQTIAITNLIEEPMSELCTMVENDSIREWNKQLSSIRSLHSVQKDCLKDFLVQMSHMTSIYTPLILSSFEIVHTNEDGTDMPEILLSTSLCENNGRIFAHDATMAHKIDEKQRTQAFDRVKARLSGERKMGRESLAGASKRAILSPSEQAEGLIHAATNPERLSQMFEGWMPWI